MDPTATAVRAEYDAAAECYDRRWAGYDRASLDLLRPLLSPGEVGRVLDLGCGTGSLAAALARWGVRTRRYVGLDLSPAMLRIAAAKHSGDALSFPASWVAGEAAALPLASAAFDGVISASSFHYWPDPRGGLREVRRVLRPGGCLLLLDWSNDYLSIRLLEHWLRWTGRPHPRAYTLTEAAALLREAGFRVRHLARRKISALWGLMVLDSVRG